MRPILFVVPGLGLRIHSYGVMIFAACAAALAMAVWRARREKVDPNAVYELATWLFLGGVIGAGLFFFIQHPEALPSTRRPVPDLAGRQRLLRLHPRRADRLDPLLVSPAVPVPADVRRGRAGGGDRRRGRADRLLPERLLPRLGLRPALGRAVPGRQPCLGPPGQRGADATRATALSLPVHPTQLYSCAAGLVVLGLLLAYARRRSDVRARSWRC